MAMAVPQEMEDGRVNHDGNGGKVVQGMVEWEDRGSW